MDSEVAAWLCRQREDRGWSKAEMARRLIQAAREANDTAVPELSGMLHNIHRWERLGGISERHRLHYCRALHIHPSQFGSGTTEPAAAVTPAPPPRGQALTPWCLSSVRPSSQQRSARACQHHMTSPTVEGKSPPCGISRLSMRS